MVNSLSTFLLPLDISSFHYNITTNMESVNCSKCFIILNTEDQGTNSFWINETWFCLECKNKHFCDCSKCRKVLEIQNKDKTLFWVNDKWFCLDCRIEHICDCSICFKVLEIQNQGKSLFWIDKMWFCLKCKTEHTCYFCNTILTIESDYFAMNNKKYCKVCINPKTRRPSKPTTRPTQNRIVKVVSMSEVSTRERSESISKVKSHHDLPESMSLPPSPTNSDKTKTRFGLRLPGSNRSSVSPDNDQTKTTNSRPKRSTFSSPSKEVDTSAPSVPKKKFSWFKSIF